MPITAHEYFHRGKLPRKPASKHCQDAFCICTSFVHTAPRQSRLGKEAVQVWDRYNHRCFRVPISDTGNTRPRIKVGPLRDLSRSSSDHPTTRRGKISLEWLYRATNQLTSQQTVDIGEWSETAAPGHDSNFSSLLIMAYVQECVAAGISDHVARSSRWYCALHYGT
jgi:hypothetical protein